MPPKKQDNKKKPSNEVVNFYEIIPKSLRPKYHNPNISHHQIGLPFRILVVGGSGSMKTNLICDMIARMNDTFGNIKIITKAQEPLYDFLKMKIPPSHLQVTEGITTTPDLSTYEDDEMKDLQHLTIFDDLVLEDKKLQDRLICPYFIRGRKVAKGVNCVYITQSYYLTPPTIRKNLTHIFLKKLSNNRDLNSILQEYNLGCDRDQLMKMYKEATSDNESFLMVDLNAPAKNRFRKNYLDIVRLEEASDEESEED
jgi:hypothetical protein